VDEAKSALRERLRERRRQRDEATRDAVGDALAVRVGEVPAIAALVAGTTSGCVTAYASFGTEPRTGPLRALLAQAGVRVLLPVIRDDGGLDWAEDPVGGDESLSTTGVSAGIPEPTSDVVAHDLAGLVESGCRVILAPALAVDLAGNRIGKAGGFYDRFLAARDDLVPGRRPLVVAVVHDDEVLDEVPVSAHDRRVDAVLTPTAYRVLGGPGTLGQ
jgi:5-formyltetrahydrofolate cyclo-ligase